MVPRFGSVRLGFISKDGAVEYGRVICTSIRRSNACKWRTAVPGDLGVLFSQELIPDIEFMIHSIVSQQTLELHI